MLQNGCSVVRKGCSLICSLPPAAALALLSVKSGGDFDLHSRLRKTGTLSYVPGKTRQPFGTWRAAGGCAAGTGAREGKAGLLADTHFEEFRCGTVSRPPLRFTKRCIFLEKMQIKSPIKLIRAQQSFPIHTVTFDRHLVLLTQETRPPPAITVISIARVLEHRGNQSIVSSLLAKAHR